MKQKSSRSSELAVGVCMIREHVRGTINRPHVVTDFKSCERAGGPGDPYHRDHWHALHGNKT